MKFLKPTPKRVTVIEAIRQLYATQLVQERGYFLTREIAGITTLTVTAVGAALNDLFRAEYIKREIHSVDGTVTTYRYQADPAMLESRQDNHAVADKLLVLQSLRSTMVGRAAAVMDSILNDYEENYGRA